MARAATPAFPVLVLAAAGLMAAPAAALAEASTAAAPSALSVTVVRPLEDKITETLLVTGSLLPREEIEVGPEIEGYRVVEILAEVGDAVAKGQVLARLSREVLETQLAQNTASAAKARAAIAQQRATVDQTLAQETEASAAVDRARQLRKSGTVSQETLDERERAVKVASAQVAAAREALIAAEAEEVFVKAQRDEIEVRLKRTEVRAPAAGIVLARTARVGAIALSARAEPLFRIAQDGAIDLDAEVPEDAMPRMKAGLKAEVTPAGFDAPLAGTVRLVSAEVDRSTRLGKVKIALPADPRLKPGAYGRGVIELGSRSGLSLPQSAVMFDAAGAYVLGVANGIVARRPVKVALKSAGRILVVDGLVAGEQVVARAGGFLREGDRVSPIETAANEVR
ncbi:efflux RND transporter periplasmic adaptor subunit [Xanthobacter tagetidis]|uniref:Efflux RND transporter periplasmic adaptor subunit n=1 Tax=Xanthobacter tagetidis TaxID=60216 RepID=A0A3L7A1P2_9HYPH|nr:efflux RND transporter periplasmic adaptor subunit [Xanthobacter tagetidis]MBB6309257.1 RND family efflux transporter MFP subunit [Xanthobacter tagetidis]RLP74213.1 efflux RND transporter periplasmic adaptor subunit [Xanthobacter tagetidis]